jgi:hypothetical protein
VCAAQDEEEEEGEGDLFEDDEAFEDEDFMDPDTDTRLTKLIGMRAKPAEGGGALALGLPGMDVAAGAGAAAATQGAPAAAVPRGTKRARSPEGGAAGGAGAGAAPAAAPPAKAPRVMDEETAAQLAAIEADCGISLAQFTEALAGAPSIAVRAARRTCLQCLLACSVCASACTLTPPALLLISMCA